VLGEVEGGGDESVVGWPVVRVGAGWDVHPVAARVDMRAHGVVDDLPVLDDRAQSRCGRCCPEAFAFMSAPPMTGRLVLRP
jgi:hypothetical protein